MTFGLLDDDFDDDVQMTLMMWMVFRQKNRSLL
jgi:hypothetical protein